MGGISYQVAQAIEELTKKDTRVVVLGHLQRGGQPTTVDRLLASRFGVAATHLIATGQSGKMVGLVGDKIESIEIQKAIAKVKTVPPNGELVQTGRDLSISFAGELD